MLLAGQPAFADPATEAAPAPVPITRPAPAPAPAFSSTPGMASQLYLDVDFQLLPPSGFNFIDTQPPYDPNRRGPAPEPSPVRVRYDSPDGNTVLSVLVRNAQNLKQSILQTTDISGLGSLEEAAKLLLPRGSRVIAGSVLQVPLPPRQTALGPVELPPKNYYRYELATPNGLHVIMSVAAQKGRIYVCGGSTLEGEVWERDAPVLRAATQSFRLRADGVTFG
ncbi:hypothetical protein HYH02_010462 [Chlamydomonas schloesseri]|uniref:PsbP C-terminal domain-containing protein n=1 Tax=Chlamydomonas schloesseri TaxID=2026947 RepID=A0A835W7B0_9CHLO|nr:hypothetical protein HYH02_010462 [Chlamydomonas schloesseri]|eukprot:KAG2439829.1 hypothetical protein HYH02_010462 [Chlamydomonas schloesseri]